MLFIPNTHKFYIMTFSKETFSLASNTNFLNGIPLNNTCFAFLMIFSSLFEEKGNSRT